VAPNSKNAPAFGAEEAVCTAVTGGVEGDLALPVIAIALWHAAVPAAAVPEAAIDEDGEAGALEDEIRAAGEGLVATPARDAVGAKDGCEP